MGRALGDILDLLPRVPGIGASASVAPLNREGGQTRISPPVNAKSRPCRGGSKRDSGKVGREVVTHLDGLNDTPKNHPRASSVQTNIAHDPARVNPEASKNLRADRPHPENRPFVQVPYDLLAIPKLSDAAKLAWAAIQKWTWRGAQPTNAALAAQCGWITKCGVPAVTKAKAALRELERAGLVTRTVTIRDGYHVRDAIEVAQPPAHEGGRNLAHPLGEIPPTGRRNPAHEGGRNLAPSEDRSRKTWKDSPRPGEGVQSQGTTTTKAKPDPTPGDTQAGAGEIKSVGAMLSGIGKPADSTDEAERTPESDARRLAELVPDVDPDKLARFRQKGATGRAEVIEHAEKAAGGDPIAILQVTKWKAAKPGPAPCPMAGDPFESIVAALHRGDPMAVEPFSSRLVSEWNDRKSRPYYDKIGMEVVTGQRTLEELNDAFLQALGPKTKHPAKVFVFALMKQRTVAV